MLTEAATGLIHMSDDEDISFWLPSIATRAFKADEIKRIMCAGNLNLKHLAQPRPDGFFSFPPSENWTASSLGFLRTRNERLECLKTIICPDGSVVDAESGRVILTPTATGVTTLEEVYFVFAAVLAEFAKSRLSMTHAVNGNARAAFEKAIKHLAAAKRALQNEHARLVTYRLWAEAVIAVNDGFSITLKALLKEVDAQADTVSIRQFMRTLEAAYTLLFGRAPGQSSNRKDGPYTRFATTFLDVAGCPESPSTIQSRYATRRKSKNRR